MKEGRMHRFAIALVTPLLTAACAGPGGAADDFWGKDGGSDLDADGDADGDGDSDAERDPAHADTVVEAPGATFEGIGDPHNAVNGVYGCGLGCSSQDVFALGYAVGADNYLTLRWADRIVRNGPGADLAVFENAFVVGGGPAVFMDQAIVEVSRDGEAWVAFPHDYTNDDETAYAPDPTLWIGFAGVTPVLLNEDTNPAAPYDPQAAGGDHIDLDDLPAGDPEADAIRAQGFTFLRIVTAPSQENPDTGAPFVKEEISNGADIDGVYAWYFE
jgi:hypothetical protein